MTTPYLLKYLFRAHFANGEVYNQPPDDLARFHPGKSAFYDVQYRQDALVKFELLDRAGNFAASVDLTSGTFISNGQYHIPNYPDVPFGPFRLVYFRRVRQLQNGTGKLVREVEYHLGWQVTTEDGRNFQQTIWFY